MTWPPLLQDPLFCGLTVLAVLLTGISKGGFGGALGAVAVPLMALAVPPLTAAAILAPVLCLVDWWSFGVHWRKWDVQNLGTLLPAALAGVGLAALVSNHLSDDLVRMLVGAIAILFPLYSWFGKTAARSPTRPSLARGVMAGGACGVTSFLAHAGSPPLIMYLLPQRLDRTRYVATMNTVFLAVNAVKLGPYAWLGQLSRETLIISALLVPLVPIGVGLGKWLHTRCDDRLFYRIVQIALILVGAQLVYAALT